LAGVAELDRAGLIVDCRVPPGNLGWQSSFHAAPRLLEVLTPRLETLPPTETILLKDDAGNLIDYQDTRQTFQMRKELAGLAEVLGTLYIATPAMEWRGHHLFFDGGINENRNRKLTYVLPVAGNPLCRMFSRGSFSLHGRVYGWWQGIPKPARCGMTINTEHVAEVDYSSLHVTILYNQAGIRLDGNPYEVKGFERNEIKLAINIAFNARNKVSAVKAIAKKLKNRSQDHCHKLLDAVMRRHTPIAQSFCSDAGVHLMRRDSDLIVAALKQVNAVGIPALPLHDALIVPSRFKQQTMDLMERAFAVVIGGPNTSKPKVK
jgi:hypothetical protein